MDKTDAVITVDSISAFENFDMYRESWQQYGNFDCIYKKQLT